MKPLAEAVSGAFMTYMRLTQCASVASQLVFYNAENTHVADVSVAGTRC